jgi:hypothetical protein
MCSSRSQSLVADEWQIAIAGVDLNRSVSSEDSGTRRRNIGVHIFQAENLRVMDTVGSITNAIHADPAYVLQTGNAHKLPLSVEWQTAL